MTNVPNPPPESSNGHIDEVQHGQPTSEALSTPPGIEPEHSTPARSSTTTTTTRDVTHRFEGPTSQSVMATRDSDRTPLPRDILATNTRNDDHHQSVIPTQHAEDQIRQEPPRYGDSSKQDPSPPPPPRKPISLGTFTPNETPPCYSPDQRPIGHPPNGANYTSRKRVASITIEDSNKHPRLQDLSLYTPGSAWTSTLIGGHGEPRELICLCTKAPKVPRPRNAFILYRQHHQASVAARHPGLANPEISKLIGEQWREQPDEVKESWKRLAEEEKLRHQRQYPDYRYQPRRGGKNGANGKPTPGAAGDDPGRCQKCGGRFIATPRTPSTPYGPMTPAFAKPIAAGLLPQTPQGGSGEYTTPGQMIHNPNPRMREVDHLMRRGSNTSMMSVDSHGRRYTQPYLGDMEEEYGATSPTAPPHKRQRYKNSLVTGYMPTSPPGTYMTRPADPRFVQQQLPSVGGTPMPAVGYAPGFLGRPAPTQQQHAAAPPPQNSYRLGHMQPPVRPSISYGPDPSVQPHERDLGPTFDESLRLPPLQTRMHSSPGMNSGATSMTATNTATGTALGYINTNAQPSPSPSSKTQPLPLNQRPQWLYRLDMLKAISPPLKGPSPGTAPFEVRGPIIALEGASAEMLRQVTAIVEKALFVSGDCAIKLWANPELGQAIEHGIKESSHHGDGTFESSEGDNNGIQTFASPVAIFQAGMLKWHRTSEELVKYITHHPPLGLYRPGDGRAEESPTASSANHGAAALKPKLPVAIISAGYSLTATDQCAAALRIADAYRPDDHWRWVATMWRGIVGADLTLYVKGCAEDELRSHQVVEFANAGVLVVRVPEGNRDGAGMAVADEKLERRLGFELMEWLRASHFSRRLT